MCERNSISGIGCPKRLQALDIKPLVDLPGVGEHLAHLSSKYCFNSFVGENFQVSDVFSEPGIIILIPKQDHLLVPSSFELKDGTTITGDLIRNAEFAAQELER